ncbi:MAG: phosphatidate cytidylyltransferase [Oscillospiraceae bacterium]|nr:phosphatidate cytidylyltransferase [Oscillospiraceae bacterium]
MRPDTGDYIPSKGLVILMLQRIMVAVIFIPVIFVIFFGLPDIVLPIILALLSMIGVHEVLWSTGFVKNVRISAISIVLAGTIPFWIFFGAKPLPFLCGSLIYFTLLFAEALHSKFSVTLEKMGGAFLFSLMIPYFLCSFIRISKLELGDFYILLPLLVSFVSDAFALFAGMAFGKHKLAPEISPKKTVEGAVGGLIFAVIGCVIYGLLTQYWFHLSVSYLALVVYGVLGSLISQFGDLSFSYIKRQYEIKDFGNILPGHGGVLDRFDSVIFCAPLIEILIRMLPALHQVSG